ncbi:MAG TPA: ABC transporter ATP-binding protein, partial [Anaerovoracaceae bacterium]|nr:ABC transporter ATP-binding protein [Anaerovoracaceae bacterium]
MLELKDLNVSVNINNKLYPVLEDISFTVDHDETLGLVGESGCGKSMAALAIMGLLRRNIKITSGRIDFLDMNLASLSEKRFETLRGSKLSMIFQDSMSSLNPLMKIGKQIEEAYEIHYGLPKQELKIKAAESLKEVGFSNPEETLNKYPHQLSGGQRQRVMIAMAISAKPYLLIADEPTTALDVTTQNKILTLIKRIQQQSHMSIILISHDITVISQTCSHVCVMYSGWIVEYGETKAIINNPKHPYTKALISSIPNETDRDKPLKIIKGNVPSLMQRPKEGCVFAGRCEFRMPDCSGEIDNFLLDDGRTVKCI